MLPHRRAAARRRTRPRRPAPARRHDALWTLALGVPLGLVACGAMVWQASYAAFTAQTSTPVNSWRTGTVNLENDAASAVFDARNVKPTSSGEACIRVTSSGTLPADIRVFGTVGGDDVLAENIDLVVQVGTGGTLTNCEGFTPSSDAFVGTLKQFRLNRASWEASSAGSWETTGTTGTPEHRTYRVGYTVRADAPDTAQNKTVSMVFTWEARST